MPRRSSRSRSRTAHGPISPIYQELFGAKAGRSALVAEDPFRILNASSSRGVVASPAKIEARSRPSAAPTPRSAPVQAKRIHVFLEVVAEEVPQHLEGEHIVPVQRPNIVRSLCLPLTHIHFLRGRQPAVVRTSPHSEDRSLNSSFQHREGGVGRSFRTTTSWERCSRLTEAKVLQAAPELSAPVVRGEDHPHVMIVAVGHVGTASTSSGAAERRRHARVPQGAESPWRSRRGQRRRRRRHPDVRRSTSAGASRPWRAASAPSICPRPRAPASARAGDRGSGPGGRVRGGAGRGP